MAFLVYHGFGHVLWPSPMGTGLWEHLCFWVLLRVLVLCLMVRALIPFLLCSLSLLIPTGALYEPLHVFFPVLSACRTHLPHL